MKFYINGRRRGLGKYLYDRLNVVETLEECDIFINNKHEGFRQVDLLYRACGLGKRVISISSNSGDGIKKVPHRYAIQKAALDKANEQLFYQGHNVTSLRFGWIDTERVAEVQDAKMTCRSILDNIEFVLLHPHRVKEMTITPFENPEPIGDINSNKAALLKEVGEERYKEQMRISYNMYDFTKMYAKGHKKLHHFGEYDLVKINEEMKGLMEKVNAMERPEIAELGFGHDPKFWWTKKNLYQIMLQSTDGKDFFTGLQEVKNIPEDKLESDFTVLNIPEDWETARYINDTGMTRTRLMVMPPKSCYSFHFDPKPRIHLAIKTNDWCFLSDEKMKLFHIPADGYPYYFDAQTVHSAMNFVAVEERIHIVGRAPLK